MQAATGTSRWSFVGLGSCANGVLNAIKLPQEQGESPTTNVSHGREWETAEPQETRSGSPFSLFGAGAVEGVPLHKVYALQKVRVSTSRRWAAKHGHLLAPPPLNAKTEALIKEWFDLVDRDGSRTLDVAELEQALKSAQIPCTQASLDEMLDLLDFNKDGVVSWDEFHTFIAFEVHSGQDLLSGELELPSGLCLPLGAMIHKLRRNVVMQKVFEGGRNRRLGLTMAKSYLSAMRNISSDDLKPWAQLGYSAPKDATRKGKLRVARAATTALVMTGSSPAIARSKSAAPREPSSPKRTVSIAPPSSYQALAPLSSTPKGVAEPTSDSPAPTLLSSLRRPAASPSAIHRVRMPESPRAPAGASAAAAAASPDTPSAAPPAPAKEPSSPDGLWFRTQELENFEAAVLHMAVATTAGTATRRAATAMSGPRTPQSSSGSSGNACSPRVTQVTQRAPPSPMPPSLAVLINATAASRSVVHGGNQQQRPVPAGDNDGGGASLTALAAAAHADRVGTAPAGMWRASGGGAAGAPFASGGGPSVRTQLPARPNTVSGGGGTVYLQPSTRSGGSGSGSFGQRPAFNLQPSPRTAFPPDSAPLRPSPRNASVRASWPVTEQPFAAAAPAGASPPHSPQAITRMTLRSSLDPASSPPLDSQPSAQASFPQPYPSPRGGGAGHALLRVSPLGPDGIGGGNNGILISLPRQYGAAVAHNVGRTGASNGSSGSTSGSGQGTPQRRSTSWDGAVITSGPFTIVVGRKHTPQQGRR